MTKRREQFVDDHGRPFDVPTDGSLGLLALGHVGLRAWREKRKAEGIDIVEEKRKEYEALEKEKEKKKEEAEKKAKRTK